jgi:hypothetical protein
MRRASPQSPTAARVRGAACRAGGLPAPAATRVALVPVVAEAFQRTARGPWHTRPFGFVAPPDASCEERR